VCGPARWTETAPDHCGAGREAQPTPIEMNDAGLGGGASVTSPGSGITPAINHQPDGALAEHEPAPGVLPRATAVADPPFREHDNL
jgi:hypothetical protein